MPIFVRVSALRRSSIDITSRRFDTQKGRSVISKLRWDFDLSGSTNWLASMRMLKREILQKNHF